jgi:hypothetical protein
LGLIDNCVRVPLVPLTETNYANLKIEIDKVIGK